MFGLFKRKSSKKHHPREYLRDLKNNIIKEGDIVWVYRYDLGKSVVQRSEQGLNYKSLETKKVVNWRYMIDASTKLQKVDLLEKRPSVVPK